jgi:hypothetical protein
MGFPEAWAAIPNEERAAIYARNLATTHWFNVWGLPGQSLSEAGQALVDLGASAILALAPLLDLRRSAPCFGSEEATVSRLFAYRVCDYAWSFIEQIQGRQPSLLASPEERDSAIEEMRLRLARIAR